MQLRKKFVNQNFDSQRVYNTLHVFHKKPYYNYKLIIIISIKTIN